MNAQETYMIIIYNAENSCDSSDFCGYSHTYFFSELNKKFKRTAFI